MAGSWTFSTLTSPVVLTATIVYYICLWYLSRKRRQKGYKVPPGPPAQWIIGNVRQLQAGVNEPWLLFYKWGLAYGPIIYYRALNKETIVLNSGKAALDLLESRSSIYSDRPTLWMVGELARRNRTVFLSPYLRRLRDLRRLLHTGLSPSATKEYREIQNAETQVFLKALVESPEEFSAHIRRNAVSAILKIAYGYHVGGNDDPLIKIIEDTFKYGGAIATPGRFLVEFLPILRYLPECTPGAGFKRLARETGDIMSQLETVPFETAKKQILSGTFIESFTSKHIVEDGQLVDEQTQDHIKWASAAIFAGAGDTTVSAIITFFLQMALHPEVQTKAQSDIDRVCNGGNGGLPSRLPTHEDYGDLPYLKAITQEVLRWAPVAPLGLPHKVTQDDIYENYFIPKGATVMANIWAITHDAEIYPDPLTFDPNRHLGDAPQPDPFRFVFGFGRRICPGAHLAELFIFLNLVRILCVFDISKAVDENGSEVEPEIEWTTGPTTHLKPFKCKVVPRSAEHLKLLDSSL